MGGPIISGTESARTLVTKNKIGYGYEKKNNGEEEVTTYIRVVIVAERDLSS